MTDDEKEYHIGKRRAILIDLDAEEAILHMERTKDLRKRIEELEQIIRRLQGGETGV